METPIALLSGGERARVMIARLMLAPADVLLLDEPTNDLDIPTLEVLEDSLLDFAGAMVVVSHDRYLLDRVSTIVIGLDQGQGGVFADYSQWEASRGAPALGKPAATDTPAQLRDAPKRKLSYFGSASCRKRRLRAKGYLRLTRNCRMPSVWSRTCTGAGLSWK
jgi:ATP-binding cassette subfamily F protein uup